MKNQQSSISDNPAEQAPGKDYSRAIDAIMRFLTFAGYAIAGALAGQFIRMHGWALTTRPHHRRFAA